jgi:hypothetical protein
LTIQPNLYDCGATVRTRQPELFAGSQVDERCPLCGRWRVMTASGFVTCPHGCEKLQPDRAADHPAGGLF